MGDRRMSVEDKLELEREICAAVTKSKCDTEALLAEAVRHLRAWVAWCDGPADPHPLDSLQAVRAFLERLDAEGGQSYPATPDVTYVPISDDTGLMDDDVLERLDAEGGQE